MRSVVRGLLALSLTSACGGEPGAGMDTLFTSSSSSDSLTETSGDDAESGGSTSTQGDGDSSTNSSSGGGPVLDVGGADQGGSAEAGGDGCSKVDLLFVVDDSISMAGEQANLVASFPDFIDAIQAQLPEADSYHVGVVTTNAYEFNANGCTELGALVTQTGGASSSAASCGPFAAGRYMTDGDDLPDVFACAAKVGVDGSTDERPIQAMTVALGPAYAGGGGCNEGFLRDDALLVVVVITDEEDDPFMFYGELQGSPGDPPDWFDTLVALKGVETNVVMLSIIGGQPGNVCPEPNGVDGAEDAPRLREFTQMFTHGFLGDVCAPNYGPIFADSISVIEQACDGFVPVD